MRAAFLAPSLGLEHGFYDVFTDIMQVAASQLGVDLQVVDCGKSAERMIAEGQALARQAQRSVRADCVLLPDYMGSGRELLPVLDDAGIGIFFVAEGIAGGARATFGSPRERYRRWLGEILPPDDDAGYLLARCLTRAARDRGKTSGTGRVRVAILSGDQSPAGLARFRGWLRLKGEDPAVEQVSFQYASWERGPARSATALILRNHPEIDVIWAASDAMALGAAEAIEESGRVPGEDVLTGGIDLGHEALVGISEGRLTVSIGGHVLDGAQAMILLHDHHEGRDFEPWSRQSSLVTVTREDAAHYRRFVEERAWKDVDFTSFSRVRNPGAAATDVSLESVVLQPRYEPQPFGG